MELIPLAVSLSLSLDPRTSLPLPTQLLHILLSTHWLSLITYSFLSLNNFSFSESAMTSIPPTVK